MAAGLTPRVGVEPRVAWSTPVDRADRLPAAVLTDLDGTLIDSEPLWSAAARAIAEAHGGPWSTADDDLVVGWSVPAVAAYLRGRGVRQDTGAIVAALHEGVAAGLSGAVPWRPGALDLLRTLREAGVPCALVTMTYRSLTSLVLRAVPTGTFAVVVAGDDVERPKPDPQAYLRAAELLRVAPDDCWAVEDSPTGTAAALASGALTFAVDPAQSLPATLTADPGLRVVAGLEPVIRSLAVGPGR